MLICPSREIRKTSRVGTKDVGGKGTSPLLLKKMILGAQPRVFIWLVIMILIL